MLKGLGALIFFMALPVSAKPVTLFFGDLKKMPYAWDAPALDSLTFNQAVFGRLINVDSDFRLKPGLLQRFYFDQSLKGYVLVLRDGLKFNNGRLVTSADLEFSLLRGFFSEKQNFFGVYFNNIEGVEAIKKGTEFKLGLVSGVNALDATRLLVRLKTPNPSFLHSLSNLVVRLVPQEELKDDYLTWKKQPVGAGEYLIKAVDEKNFAVTIEPKASWAEPASFTLLYSKGENKPDVSFVEMPGYQSNRYTRPSYVTAVFFSNKSPLVKQVGFRKSFSDALESRSPGQSNIEPATELLPQPFWGRGMPKRERGKVSTFEGKKVVGRILNLGAKPSPGKEALRQTVDATIQKLKASSDVEYTNSKFLENKGDGTADVFGFSILADYFDPLIMFNTFGPSSPLKIVSLAGDAKFVKLYDKASRAGDFDQRLESIKALSKYVMEQQYVVPIHYEYAVVYFDPQKISTVGDVSVPNLIHLDQIKVKK